MECLKGLRVLIIEDESMVTMLIEDTLADLGCAVVGSASRLDEAMAKASSLECNAAILDVNLNGSHTYAVADVLAARGIPFIFATGYGAAGLPAGSRGAPRSCRSHSSRATSSGPSWTPWRSVALASKANA